MGPNFENYSIEQLYEVLESIDDIKYPQRTEQVLQLLLIKTGQDTVSLLDYYHNDNSCRYFALFSSLAMDVQKVHRETHDKIERYLKKAAPNATHKASIAKR